jgi:hypothetical protein
MPYKEKPIRKVYYKKGEVIEITGLTVTILRKIADKNPNKMRRGSRGNRYFTADFVDTIKEYAEAKRLLDKKVNL